MPSLQPLLRFDLLHFGEFGLRSLRALTGLLPALTDHSCEKGRVEVSRDSLDCVDGQLSPQQEPTNTTRSAPPPDAVHMKRLLELGDLLLQKKWEGHHFSAREELRVLLRVHPHLRSKLLWHALELILPAPVDVSEASNKRERDGLGELFTRIEALILNADSHSCAQATRALEIYLTALVLSTKRGMSDCMRKEQCAMVEADAKHLWGHETSFSGCLGLAVLHGAVSLLRAATSDLTRASLS